VLKINAIVLEIRVDVVVETTRWGLFAGDARPLTRHGSLGESTLKK
jgi:hypothetical protein